MWKRCCHLYFGSPVFSSSNRRLSSAGESHLSVVFVGDGRGLEGMSSRELEKVFPFIL